MYIKQLNKHKIMNKYTHIHTYIHTYIYIELFDPIQISRSGSGRIEVFGHIGSDRIGPNFFWGGLRSDRIGSNFFFSHFGSDRIGSDRATFWVLRSDRIGSDRIGSKHAFTHLG